MKGQLILMNNINFADKMIDIEYSEQNSFDIDLYIDEKKSLENQLPTKEMIINKIDEELEFCELFELEKEEKELKIYDTIKENADNIYENIEYVKLYLDNIDEKEFIDNNPIIQNKKIIISEYISISDYDKVIKLLEKYAEYKENIYVPMEGNKYNVIRLNDCFETINKIKQQANDILLLNLSPLETIMYTYDQVRNRVYKEELDGDSASISRDLSSVLNNEEIVCAGYANIFSALLNYMNIKCFNANIEDKNDKTSGHARNIIYVKDDKYKIDGVYYFDVTWDSKKKNETNEFLNRYRFFAKTRNEMVEIENDYFDFEYKTFKYYYEDMVENREKITNKIFEEEMKIDEETNFHLVMFKYICSLNYMTRIVGREDLKIEGFIYNCDKEKENQIKKIVKKYNKPISAETYIELLNNVRKVEYEQDPEFYPYSVEKIYETYLRSEWIFKNHYYDPQDRLLLSIFGDKAIEDRNDEKEDFIQFISEKSIDREIYNVKTEKNKLKIKNK